MAERLPVILIPKEIHVAFVRDDMIDLGCGSDATMSLTLSAQRVLDKKSLGRSQPLVGVASLRACQRVTVALMLLRGLLAMALAVA